MSHFRDENGQTLASATWLIPGFSDPLTAFLALDTTVELYQGGLVSLDDYVSMKYDRDILVRIHIKKDGRKAAYQSFRNTKTDFPVSASNAASFAAIRRCSSSVPASTRSPGRRI